MKNNETIPGGLSVRTRGWLRYLWDKATTKDGDDWSSKGEPLPWWDQHSLPPMCNFPRWDLSEGAAILPILCDQTPAWREVYTRIADEFVGRHTTFWAGIDWLTFIGPHRNWDDAPPEWVSLIPEGMRGRNYPGTAWVANGIEPWGLQPDPIGSDGNLFFRGFLNYMLSIYRYVSGSKKWESPFKVVGYNERLFEWTHTQIAEFIHNQWKDQPQGAFCENTKIFPFCLSGAGLGLKLYDNISESSKPLHGVYDDWVEFARKHYLVTDRNGRLRQLPFYYDPVADEISAFPEPFSIFAGLVIAHYVLPQNIEFGTYLYEQAIDRLGWNNPSKSVVSVMIDPRFLITGLLCARELGDHATMDNLQKYVEEHYQPGYFYVGEGLVPHWFDETHGDEERRQYDRFGWKFGLNEPYPRGQLSALAMLCEAGEPGSWSRPFRQPNRNKFHEPTVEKIDYPNLGVERAWNDMEKHVLHVGTCIQTLSQKNRPTRFHVTQLPDAAAVRIWCNGQPFSRWRAISSTAIEIETEVAANDFKVETRSNEVSQSLERGARESSSGVGVSAAGTPGSERHGSATDSAGHYSPQSGAAACPCCQPGSMKRRST